MWLNFTHMSQKPHGRTSNFLCTLPVAMAQSSSDSVSIHYILPVWQMTLSFYTMGPVARIKHDIMFIRVGQVAVPIWRQTTSVWLSSSECGTRVEVHYLHLPGCDCTDDGWIPGGSASGRLGSTASCHAVCTAAVPATSIHCRLHNVQPAVAVNRSISPRKWWKTSKLVLRQQIAATSDSWCCIGIQIGWIV